MIQALEQSPEIKEVYRGHQNREIELLAPVLPEEEKHGRSLSAVRRLGVASYENPNIDLTACPEADQVKIEFYTSVEEGLGTDKEFGTKMKVNKTLSLKIDQEQGCVLSFDNKTTISQMTENGVICAKKEAKKDPRFQFQYKRSLFDDANAHDVDAMVRGEREYNTKIVVTPYPEEAARKVGSSYVGNMGYVPSLKRGFVQLYHVKTQGEELYIPITEGELILGEDELLAGSYSFEGSDIEHLYEVFQELGVHVPEGVSTDEWLQFALTDNLTAEQAVKLAQGVAKMCNQKIAKHSKAEALDTVNMTAKNKTLIDRIFYESYAPIALPTVTGQQTSELKNVIKAYCARSHHFSKEYQDALSNMMKKDTFDDEDAAVMHELLVYSTIEVLRAIELEQTVETQKIMYNVDPEQLAAISSRQLQEMLGGFGGYGAKNKRTYEACGNGIDPAGADEFLEALGLKNPQEIFGGKYRRGRRDKFGSLTFRCPKGHENEREPGKLMPECKVCGIDVSCGKADGHSVKGGEAREMKITELIDLIISLNKKRTKKAELSKYVTLN